MIPGWAFILAVLVYLGALFTIAHYGDTRGRHFVRKRARATIYALALGVYCTSWTFFGSVGFASSAGLDFLTIYIGPFLVLLFGQRLIARVITLAKSQNITSIADFIAARYGKSQAVAALVASIAVIGVVPYIALQLKAISVSLTTVLGSLAAGHVVTADAAAVDSALPVALILAGFAIAFGTRQVDATEHQDGLMLAVAVESIVKLVSFLVVGLYTTFGLFRGFADLAGRAVASAPIRTLMLRTPDAGTWITMSLLSACAILLLPRQFHVMIVENRNERDVRTAGRLFPLYLLAINLFVVPIAIAGLLTFPDGAIDRDMTVLALPIVGHAGIVTLLTLIGGLSAATAMVIVACVALSIMVSNDLVMPLLLRRTTGRSGRAPVPILAIRRIAILGIVCFGYVYLRTAGEAALASIGLLSFAAIAQIAPAFFGALFWHRGTARGALAGLGAGILVWAYTLFLPSFAPGVDWLEAFVAHGPFDIAALRPTALLGLQASPLTHGVFWSLAANMLAFIGVSLLGRPSAIEKVQASLFVGTSNLRVPQGLRLWRASLTVGELEDVVARYLGRDHAQRTFEDFMRQRGWTSARESVADVHVLRFAEHALAAAIGAASSRLVLSILLRRHLMSSRSALDLLDDASAAIQYNRDLLQHALDHARQGIAVFDHDLRLICWNREFRDLFDLPGEMVVVGIKLEEIVRFNAVRGLYGAGSTEAQVAARIDSVTTETDPFRLQLHHSGKVVEMRSARMPDGGVVTTYSDVTASVAAEKALEATNETLERRVHERTEELVRLNSELARAKAEADEANLSKTRFLAAASHDILQPLNAARLYATALTERSIGRTEATLARNIDASLEAVEEILTVLLDMSRLDAGAYKPEWTSFRIDSLFHQLQLEFEPLAREKGLRLAFMASSATVRSDKRLLRRLLRNLVSNAVKYTIRGRVLVGCRRRGDHLHVQVWDTGLGIAEAQQRSVFREFHRLDEGARLARGLGLGLSIVERISRVLGHRIVLRSTIGKGSMFALEVPIAPPIPAEVAAAAAAGRGTAQPLAGLAILVIDNDAAIVEGMQTLLGGWGCRVLAAADLDEALGLVEAGPAPDGVIADYHLDRGDGIEAIATLRGTIAQHLPAALLTADRSMGVRERAVGQTIHVLHKPLKPAALRALLAQWRVRRREVDGHSAVVLRLSAPQA